MERYPSPNMSEKASVIGKRLSALFLDGLLVILVSGALGYVGGFVLRGSRGGLGGLILGAQFVGPLLLLLYHVVLEGYYGQTLGKRLVGIVVVKSDGSSMTWGASVIRNLLRIVDSLPTFYILGAIVAYATDDHQRIGDIASSTVVVHTRQ